MIIKVLRQDNPTSKPYIATFKYESTGRKSVAHIIDELNYADDLFDIDGKLVRKIIWDCSCLQKTCGSCAIVINGVPALACGTFIDIDKTKELTLSPLSKFPVICDLSIDRSAIYLRAKEAELYVKGDSKFDSKEYEHQYLASKCMKCGLCLEVCPNYKPGADFYGAVFANEDYLVSSVSTDNLKQKEAYKKHFEGFCSKSLSCQGICPANIPTLSSISKMNR